MKKPLILIGGGGHCKSCIDVIEAEGKHVVVGIIDTPEKIGDEILHYPIVGDDENIDAFIKKEVSFLITIGQIKSSHKRRTLFQNLKSKGAQFATIIAPSAVVSRYTYIGEGTIIMHGVHVNAGAYIGANVILNTACLIEHDAQVGNHVHISTHAILNGAAIVEEDSFIGSNAVVAQGVTVRREIIVGAGSVVISNLSLPGTYIGNPAKRLNK